ncbi:hypothetical protein EVAR_53207_1 [Eumeta japonica]|uniref:Uncharacterized protein n=1 Tax=Eumeta variegata TaxID=151549 RepID=A0A4C1XGG5_EUMVA|nr:hypothetical protein EVAR_53207_1 [Eumeta japonica]
MRMRADQNYSQRNIAQRQIKDFLCLRRFVKCGQCNSCEIRSPDETVRTRGGRGWSAHGGGGPGTEAPPLPAERLCISSPDPTLVAAYRHRIIWTRPFNKVPGHRVGLHRAICIGSCGRGLNGRPRGGRPVRAGDVTWHTRRPPLLEVS